MTSSTPSPEFVLKPGVLRQATDNPDEIVLWVRGAREEHARLWQRIAGDLRTRSLQAEGAWGCPVEVSALEEALPPPSKWAPLLRFLSRPAAPPPDAIPAAERVKEVGQPRGDAFLAWAEDPHEPLDAPRIARLWPGRRQAKQLGPQLFLVLGVELPIPDLEPPEPEPGSVEEESEPAVPEPESSSRLEAWSAPMLPDAPTHAPPPATADTEPLRAETEPGSEGPAVGGSPPEPATEEEPPPPSSPLPSTYGEET
jgi:hypothetical protein